MMKLSNTDYLYPLADTTPLHIDQLLNTPLSPNSFGTGILTKPTEPEFILVSINENNDPTDNNDYPNNLMMKICNRNLEGEWIFDLAMSDSELGEDLMGLAFDVFTNTFDYAESQGSGIPAIVNVLQTYNIGVFDNTKKLQYHENLKIRMNAIKANVVTPTTPDEYTQIEQYLTCTESKVQLMVQHMNETDVRRLLHLLSLFNPYKTQAFLDKHPYEKIVELPTLDTTVDPNTLTYLI